MVRYTLRRLLVIPVALIAIIVLVYGYAHIVQWQYADRYRQLYYQLKVIEQRPEALVPALRDYFIDLTHFDLGHLRNGESIAVVLKRITLASLGLLATALAVSIPLGLLLGILSAQWKRLRPARWLTVVSTAGQAMPSFYVGSLLILASVAYTLMSKNHERLPFPLAGFGWDLHLVFPVAALSVRPTVQIAQVTGTLLTDELGKNYVVAARSLGYTKGMVKRRIAFRNILAPVILTIAGSLRTLVTDLILVEWLFFWPGLGRFIATALIPASRTDMANSPYLLEPPLLTALLATVAALFLLSDFVASVLIRLLDPRLRVAVGEEVSNV